MEESAVGFILKEVDYLKKEYEEFVISYNYNIDIINFRIDEINKKINKMIRDVIYTSWSHDRLLVKLSKRNSQFTGDIPNEASSLSERLRKHNEDIRLMVKNFKNLERFINYSDEIFSGIRNIENKNED